MQSGGLCEKWCLFCFLTFLRAQISTQSLHLSPTFKHLLKEQTISYPMHVSSHGMVEWVQKYACAKLSETLAGMGLSCSWGQPVDISLTARFSLLCNIYSLLSGLKRTIAQSNAVGAMFSIYGSNKQGPHSDWSGTCAVTCNSRSVSQRSTYPCWACLSSISPFWYLAPGWVCLVNQNRLDGVHILP